MLAQYRKRLVDEALAHIGSPSAAYRGPESGRSTETGFDCSGFVTYLLEEIGFPKPTEIRHVSEYFDRFGILIHRGLHDAGDLVFWSWNGYKPQHIGVVVSKKHYVAARGRDGDEVEKRTLKSKPIVVPADSRSLQNYSQTLIGFKRLAVPNGRWQQVD